MRTYILQTDVDSNSRLCCPATNRWRSPKSPTCLRRARALQRPTPIENTATGDVTAGTPFGGPKPDPRRDVVAPRPRLIDTARETRFASFNEPRESELRGANAVKEDSLARFDTSIEKDQLFSDESPSLYEQETAILKKQNLSGALTFDDHEPGLRALDGHEQNTKNERRKDSVAEEPAFLHYAKELKKEQKFEKGNLAAVDLPDAPPRQAIYRRQKRTSPAIYFAFFALMAGVGFFLLWRPSPDTVYQFETPSGTRKNRVWFWRPHHPQKPSFKTCRRGTNRNRRGDAARGKTFAEAK